MKATELVLNEIGSIYNITSQFVCVNIVFLNKCIMLFMYMCQKGSWNAGTCHCNNESSSKEMFNKHE
jgi:hypothetical protein